jgi:hypothetical protein
MRLINFKDIEISNVEYEKPQIIDENTYLSVVKHKNLDITFSTPKLKCSYVNLNENDNELILELEFNKNQWNFYQFIQSLDEQNILIINKKSPEWFKQNFPLDVIDDFYHSNIKVKKSNIAPIIKFRINLNSILNIKTNTDQVIKLTDLKPNCELVLNLKFKGLKFLRQQVFCDWQIDDIFAYNLTIFKDSIKNVFMNKNFSDDEFDNPEEPEKIKFKKIDLKKKNPKKSVKFKETDKEILDNTRKELDKYKKLYSKNEKEMEELKQKINSILN